MKDITLKIIQGVVFFCLCSSASAALLDFTDDTVGFSGTIDGVAYWLEPVSNSLSLNRNEGYDGGTCFHSNFKCDNDGVGIRDDEIGHDLVNGMESVSLKFESNVLITEIHLLDLFTDGGTERAVIKIAGYDDIIIDGEDILNSGAPGYATNDALLNIVTNEIIFTAVIGDAYNDGSTQNNDYAIAGLNVSAVPLPAAVWLFGSALVGLIGFRKKSA